MDDKDIDEAILPVKKDTCCVCNHSLDNHIDEGDGWRCHSLGQSGMQCECYLRKDRTQSEGKKYYDLYRRLKEYFKEVLA